MTPEREHVLREAFSVYRDTQFYVGDGWYTLLADMGLRMEGLPFRVVEVKEKFGALRVFYCTLAEDAELPEEMYESMELAVRDAESRSYDTCECCGRPGRRWNNGYIVVRCVPCAEALSAWNGNGQA